MKIILSDFGGNGMSTPGQKVGMTNRVFLWQREFCFILLTVFCGLFPVRCTKKIYQVDYPAIIDGKYDTEFPYKDCSKQLMEIGETVRRVNCIAYYKTYVFKKEDDIIDQRLKSTNLAKKASYQFYYDKTSSGTATVIYNEDGKIGLLTCAHIVDNPDTVVTYFMPDSLEKIKIIQSVAVKREQQNWVPDLPVGNAMEIIHMDSDKDIAILGKSGIRSDKRVPVFQYPYGKSSNLGWGSFVYIFGYPIGNKMITRAIVSNPRKDGKGNFLIDANFNRGLSGGIVLAIKDGVPNFEMVGMAKSVSASNEYILQPKEKVEDYSYDPRIPYLGDTYVRLQSTINYGVTHVISMETIKEYIQENEDVISGKGYYFHNFFK
jgi:hypothetical protein